jgi:hypothetical protein
VIMAKKLFDEKKHVKIIEHEKLHFNWKNTVGCECRRETIRDGKERKRRWMYVKRCEQVGRCQQMDRHETDGQM